MNQSNQKSICLACGEELKTAALLVCLGCLGEGCELFVTASEEDLEQPDEILTEAEDGDE